MTPTPPRFIELPAEQRPDARDELQRGLLRRPAAVSPKYFYDRLGSALFVAITELDEYPLTRQEAAILAQHAPAMVQQARAWLGGEVHALVDLGAGDCAKAARLLPLLAPPCYVAVDISVAFVQDALLRLSREQPGTAMVGLGLDFSQRLELPAGLLAGPALVFYPGSSIGNFTPPEARRLLSEARQASAGGALLIGVDLVKDVASMEAAYDDALGVTAAFNLNLLRHANRLLGSNFDARQWQHLAWFNAAESRVEMHLQARQGLCVAWPGHERWFEAGERIHTENACKWTLPGFEALLRAAGFTRLQCWTDDAQGFAVFLAA